MMKVTPASSATDAMLPGLRLRTIKPQSTHKTPVTTYSHDTL
jgi:hypothetical protein